MKLTTEMILKMFRRISDEDVSFMGFSPLFSRPDNMICQVLAVPPPSVRPSVKHDAQQRSEDDLSHILVNIIKANKTLQEKIEQNSPANVIEDWSTVLQYYIATMVDNKIPGVASVAQRSGRQLKAIKERLSGKQGRVRGNLMGKRVDFSARSVITPDPNLSIRELGIPLKVAKNITKPVYVNQMNKKFLLKLVQNGPDVYPGAKILEKKNGDNISLRYVDRNSINLQIGDIVHRHMMDGDAILFNRQPTLHRMSMMCHIAKVLKKGDTFRMNVGCTKPYNADFDGDEMNLHMPQDVEAETELRNLAAVPYQIISPANNQSIIGIFQDSLLGCYRFSQENVEFNPRTAMSLMINLVNINEDIFLKKENITNFNILSQIIPPISLYQKTKAFKDGDDKKTSNKILEINNGEYKRGQIDKSVLGSGTKGLIQRIFNDYGNISSSNFIDNIQFIVNEYMKIAGYSVGISDLIADDKTNQKISEVIIDKKKEVRELINETHLGVFENNTGKSNVEEFETRVNNILNEANAKAGKIGKESLSSDNRFVIMVNAGSKGSDINISQMISCLGQQNVDGKRIPYGFNSRTLPHFNKFDDSPNARGFVESSFISGLSPEELFFHAMGGRVGLIDTAVKTSQTGYIQRRLIKGMEDLYCSYDGTVRNNKNKVIQFSYGDDNMDTVRVENQVIPICNMTLDELYMYLVFPVDQELLKLTFNANSYKKLKKELKDIKIKEKEYIDYMVSKRLDLMKYVFKNKDNNVVHIPVAFNYIINNIKNQLNITPSSKADLSPIEAFEIIESGLNRLENSNFYKPTELFKLMYYYYLYPNELIIIKHFNKKAVIMLVETVILYYKQSIIQPGEMCGMISAQSIGEPTTQMTLNTFHFAGVASKSNVTRGVPRIEEILSLSENPKNPSVTIYLKENEQNNKNKAQEYIHIVEHTKLLDITEKVEILFDPDDMNTLIEEDKILLYQYKEFQNLLAECLEKDVDDNGVKSKWIIRITLDKETMLDKNINMDDVCFAIKNSYKEELSCVYSDYNDDKLVIRIRLDNVLQNKKKKKTTLDQSDDIYILRNFQEQLLNNIVLKGVKNINKVIIRKITDNISYQDSNFKKEEIWVLDTVGTNLMDIISLDFIDQTRTYSNDIIEMYKIFGIEAVRQSIYSELAEVIEFDGTYINSHHIDLLCDRMTSAIKLCSIFRHGINNDDIGPIAKASFEETPEMFLKAAKHAEIDFMRGVSANIMCGQEGFFGTGSFKLLLDTDEIKNISPTVVEDKATDIDEIFADVENPNDMCSTSNIAINNNVSNLKSKENVDDDEYNINF
jgi:DNA-directed RNA polymerase II subunit RPB1